MPKKTPLKQGKRYIAAIRPIQAEFVQQVTDLFFFKKCYALALEVLLERYANGSESRSDLTMDLMGLKGVYAQGELDALKKFVELINPSVDWFTLDYTTVNEVNAAFDDAVSAIEKPTPPKNPHKLTASDVSRLVSNIAKTDLTPEF